MKVQSLKSQARAIKAEMAVAQHLHHHLLLVPVVRVERHLAQDQVGLHQYVQALEVRHPFDQEVQHLLPRQVLQLLRVLRVDQVEQQLHRRRLHVRVHRNRQREYKSK
jgi:hypothetical protein